MAWAIRWQMQFQSVKGKNYTLNIYDQNYTGEVQTLTGAAQPFTTSEDNDSDVFKPVRGQTGYINIVTSDNTLLETLLPQTNTSRLVRLIEGTTVVWQGFLSTDVYTQTWNGGTREIELAVNSVVQTLESVCLHSDISGARYPMAKLITLADEMLGGGVVEHVYNYEDAKEEQCWLTWRVDFQTFFASGEDEDSGGDDTVQQINTDGIRYGVSLYEALKWVCSLAGLTLQERGTSWFFTRQDIDRQQSRCIMYPLAQIQNIVNGHRPTYTRTMPSMPSLLPSVEWRGIDNNVDYENGRRMAIVETDVTAYDEVLKIPGAEPNDTTVYEINVCGRKFFGQAADSLGGYTEEYIYHEYSQQQLIADATRQQCINNSMLVRPNYLPYEDPDDHLYTGAFHCRYYYRKKATDTVYLGGEGLMLNFQYYLPGMSNPTPRKVYTISSRSTMSFYGGWLRLNFGTMNFIQIGFDYSLISISPDDWLNLDNILAFVLKIGDKVWNPTTNQWEDQILDLIDYRFTVRTRSGEIITNKTDDMQVDAQGGFFVPVPEGGIDGQVQLHLLDCLEVFAADKIDLFLHSHTHILKDLEITYEQDQGMTYSKKTENRYKKHITNSGFKGNVVVSLPIGTFNNNLQAVNFIRSQNGDYIEGVDYYDSMVEVVSNRPELHLLDRLYTYYQQVRRRLTGNFLLKTWSPLQRLIYNGRQYMAVIQNRDWQADIDEVMFIETKTLSASS